MRESAVSRYAERAPSPALRRKKRSEELLAKVAHKAHSLAARGEQKQRVLSAAIPRFCWRTPPDSTIAGMVIESLQRLARMHGQGLTHDPRVPSSGERIMHREAGRMLGRKKCPERPERNVMI